MTEPPRAPRTVDGTDRCEYFRDEQGADTLLFIDNIFALHGRIKAGGWATCHRIGYQLTHQQK
jgi:F0F1-type ATP synthase beta subunit